MTPELCVGSVMHVRHSPATNRFCYPLFFLRLPLSSLGDLRLRLLGVNRRAAMRIEYSDHGPRDGSHPQRWIRTLLQHHGIHADGEIILQTMPRMFGFVFNPVSFWYCHDVEGALRAVLCEVNNTFGERHNYLVAHGDGSAIGAGDSLWARKVFHVSPFFPVSGEYRFRFTRRGAVQAVAIDYFESGRIVLTTRLAGRARPLDDRSLLSALVRFPLMTCAVVLRIHWQALRLAVVCRASFFRKPQPPLEETTT
ncbi:MAG: DUF1365 domain-containing protein [Rhodocyclaceae bacterium]|nr:DUF1365 domain-containing protein [Rhodocyclaceae bacterium]